MTRVVAYYRVSTRSQQRSGLGLEAQRAAVLSYVRNRHDLVAEFTETESGKNNDRPKLAAALHRARVSGSILLLARLDRLSRNAGFLLTLRDSGVRFTAVDMPDATEMTVGIMAVIAEAERKAIASRTRDALAAAKARGRLLGNPANLVPGFGQKAASMRTAEIADQSARDLIVVIDDIKAHGVTTLSGIARELETRRIQTPRGRAEWRPEQVRRVIIRSGAAG